MLWKLLIVALITMLIAGSVAAQETPTPEPLTTVQRRAVRVFMDDGILEGTSCSIRDCSGTIERWEVALWIVRLLDSEPTNHRAFVDVDAEKPYAGYVQTLFDLGVTVGCLVDPLQYCPTRETRRGQMAAFVTRAYDFDDTIPPHGFADVPRSHPFRDDISALKNAGIVSNGCADDGERLFCPDDSIVAAEAVEWLYRAARLDTTDSRGGGAGNGGGGNTGGGGNGGGGGGRNGGNTGGGNTGGGNTGGGNIGGGNTGTNPPATNPPATNPPATTQPPLIPTLTGNDGIDLVNGECTHHDRHFQGASNDQKSYMILDGHYPVSLVFDDNGPYASVAEHQEFFRHDALPLNAVANYRYRVELNTLRDVYFTHWHDGADIRWVYWIPATVLERAEDSVAAPISDEVLFEDGSGNRYRRLRNARGGLDYGPFDSPPACNDHSHPPETGNYMP